MIETICYCDDCGIEIEVIEEDEFLLDDNSIEIKIRLKADLCFQCFSNRMESFKKEIADKFKTVLINKRERCDTS